MVRSLSKREQILEVSAQLFRKQGFVATTMQDIASQLSIKPASLYNHIDSKQEILQTLLLSKAKKFVGGMRDITASSLTPIEKLQKVIGLHVRMTVEHTNDMALMVGEWKHLEDDAKRQYVKARNSYDKSFRLILRACVCDGYLKDLPIGIMLFSILSTLRYLYSWFDRNRGISSIELEKQLYQSLITGLLIDA